eukprot:m.131190 g.131190  ORF g.131190 m.131190 type:complete len:137 (+) comp14616_c0_seq4:892-1302(+)
MDALWTYAHSFRWEYGVTPLSSLQAIGCAWLCYFTTLILLQKFMEGREPFKLRQVTALHNLILMIWSAGMFASVLYGLWLLYDRYGYASLFCAANDEQTTGIVAFSLCKKGAVKTSLYHFKHEPRCVSHIEVLRAV